MTLDQSAPLRGGCVQYHLTMDIEDVCHTHITLCYIYLTLSGGTVVQVELQNEKC